MIYKNNITCPACEKNRNFWLIKDTRSEKAGLTLYQCVDCKCQFWLPMQLTPREFYEDRENYRFEAAEEIKIFRGFHKLFLKRHKSFAQGTKVLDVGCGTGEFIAELEKRGCEVWGVDFDRGAIETAKKRLHLKNVYALSFEEFFKKEDLPKFDIITFFEVLEHVHNPLAFIKEVKKMLALRGKIMMSTPSRERMLSRVNNWDFPPHHLIKWNPTAISNLYSEIDFGIHYIAFVEQYKLLSNTLSSFFSTGLVKQARQLGTSTEQKKFTILQKIFYILAWAKIVILGKIPALFLYPYSRLMGYKNGTMFIELTSRSKKQKLMLFALNIEGGGMERVISTLSLNMPADIERCIVLAGKSDNHPYYEFGCKVMYLNVSLSNNNLPLKFYYFIKSIILLRREIKNEKPDKVMSFGLEANIINVLSTKKSVLRADVSWSITLTAFEKFVSVILFRFAKEILCISYGVANDVVESFNINKDKVRVLYSPFNTQEIKTMSQEPLEEKYQEIFRHPVVMNIGRMTGQKGQWHLMRAFQEVRREVPDVKLVIRGMGKREEEYKALVAQLGLANDVYFLGWQKNVYKFLKQSKVFVFSSTLEGFGNVVVEAMACGLPVISTDCQWGPREIIAPHGDVVYQTNNIDYAEYGILTPPFEQNIPLDAPLSSAEQMLAKAMIDVLTHNELAENLRKKSLERADDFDSKEKDYKVYMR